MQSWTFSWGERGNVQVVTIDDRNLSEMERDALQGRVRAVTLYVPNWTGAVSVELTAVPSFVKKIAIKKINGDLLCWAIRAGKVVYEM